MTISAAVAVLSDLGLVAITNSITSGLPISVSKFELGEVASVEVPSNATSAIPVAKYTGPLSKVTVEQEHGLAVFNLVLDETIGDFYVGNVALMIVDPVTDEEVLLAVVMFPSLIYKLASESNGGGTGETGNYFLVKLVIKLSTLQAVATVTLNNTHYAVLPTADSLDSLADSSGAVHPHQLLLRGPDFGKPALIAKRPGDNIWWAFGLSWSVDDHDFGVISGGYQGDWYATDNVKVIFGGYFHTPATDFDETISGGTNWENSDSSTTVFGGSWT